MTYLARQKIYDSDTGLTAHVTPRRDLSVSTQVRILGSNFNGTTLDPNVWTSSVSGTGAVAQANAQVVLSTGATANSSAQITTTRQSRFLSSTVNYHRGIIQLSDTGATNNVRRWGCFDDNNGLFYQLSGTTLSIVSRKATVDTAVASASWNRSTFTLDTNAHSYEIVYNKRAVWWYIDDTLVHYSDFATATWAASSNLYMRLQNTNSGGGTSDVSLTARASTIERYGEHFSRPTFYNIANVDETRVLKYGPGTLHRIILNGPDSTGTLTLYDNTAASGTKIGTIDFAKSSAITSIEYGTYFSNGLTYVSASGIGDVTIVWD